MPDRYVGLIAAAILSCVLVSDVVVAAEVPDPDAGSLAAKAQEISARFQSDVRTIEIRAYAAQSGATLTITIKRKGEKLRTDTVFMPPEGAPKETVLFKSALIIDGSQAWLIESHGQKSAVDLKESRNYPADFFGWELATADAKVLGTEKVVERDCIVIVPGPSAPPTPYTKVWLDARNLVLVKAEWTEQGMEGAAAATLINSNFKEVEKGWEIPYEVRIWKDGMLWYLSAVKEAGVNVPIDDAAFDPDKAGDDSELGKILKHGE